MILLKGFVLHRKCKNRRMQRETQGPVIVQGPHLSTISRLFRVQDFIPSNEALKSHELVDLPPTYAELFTVPAVPTDHSPSIGPCPGQSNIDRPPPLPTSAMNTANAAAPCCALPPAPPRISAAVLNSLYQMKAETSNQKRSASMIMWWSL